jgi:hypothetical protein
MEPKQVIGQFVIKGMPGSVETIGSGHINASYRIKNTEKSEPDYLLQSINTNIFKDVEALTSNIVKVTCHIGAKYPAAEALKKSLTPIQSKDGKYYFKDEKGIYWRAFIYIKDSKIFDVVNSEKIAREAGKAFGNFQKQLSDLPIEGIFEVLPRFHDPLKRIPDFKEAVKNNAAGRLQDVKEEVDFALARTDEMMRISKLAESGALKKRIAHYDTKCSNILFNDKDEAMCVIDLDTVMPGYIINDFGDSIRTFANTAVEDEADLSKIHLNLPIFKAYAKGYLESASSFITQTERDNLAFAAKYITYEQGIRFLGDYLNGDVYYHIKHPQHNKQRAKAQFKFLSELENHFGEMEKIISDFS